MFVFKQLESFGVSPSLKKPRGHKKRPPRFLQVSEEATVTGSDVGFLWICHEITVYGKPWETT